MQIFIKSSISFGRHSTSAFGRGSKMWKMFCKTSLRSYSHTLQSSRIINFTAYNPNKICSWWNANFSAWILYNLSSTTISISLLDTSANIFKLSKFQKEKEHSSMMELQEYSNIKLIMNLPPNSSSKFQKRLFNLLNQLFWIEWFNYPNTIIPT